MAPSSIDRALIEATKAALEANKEIKRERARAMDTIVDLLLERARLRSLLRQAYHDHCGCLGTPPEEARDG